MKTQRGIYLNLKESTYTFCIDDLTFFFSSKLYCEKFKNNVLTFIQNETFKLQQRYSIKINFDMILMLSYYKQIEKRGFYVKIGNRELNENAIITNIIIDLGDLK